MDLRTSSTPRIAASCIPADAFVAAGAASHPRRYLPPTSALARIDEWAADAIGHAYAPDINLHAVARVAEEVLGDVQAVVDSSRAEAARRARSLLHGDEFIWGTGVGRRRGMKPQFSPAV